MKKILKMNWVVLSIFHQYTNNKRIMVYTIIVVVIILWHCIMWCIKVRYKGAVRFGKRHQCTNTMFDWGDFERKGKEGKEIEKKGTYFPCLDIENSTVYNSLWGHQNNAKIPPPPGGKSTENGGLHFSILPSPSLFHSDPLFHSFPVRVPPPLPSFSIAAAPSGLFAAAAFLLSDYIWMEEEDGERQKKAFTAAEYLNLRLITSSSSSSCEAEEELQEERKGRRVVAGSSKSRIKDKNVISDSHSKRKQIEIS